MYRQIPSFCEYLIIAQDRVYVEHHVRENQHRKVWTMREYTKLEDIVTLGAVNVELRLADVYAKVAFPAAAA